MFFVGKIFFAALAAIPILILIYFLHRKVKTIEISSLIFWENQLKDIKSGTGIKAIPLPLKFFLEALIIILLVLAAAGPFLVSKEKVPALTVILDDSFSMQAGAPNTPRKQAEKALLKMLSSSPSRQIHFILAGPTPRLLDETDSGSVKVKHILERWLCKNSSADIDGALLFARRTFGKKNDILILTDYKPDFEQLPSGMIWGAFGTATGNIAIINASRTSFPGGDKCLVEVVNYSSGKATIPVKVEFPGTKEKPVIYQLHAAQGEKAKHIFKLDIKTGPVKISIPDDQLKFDNSIILLPEKRKLLRVKISKLNKTIRQPLEKSLKLTGMVRFTDVEPQLFFSGVAPEKIPDGDAWFTIILNSAKSKSFIGPYTIDRQHPLCYGIQLDGVIWGADDSQLPGKAIILAGNTPLVSDHIVKSNRHMIFIKFSPDKSTFQDSPNFPAMIFNLIDWRLKALPGLNKSNYRTGEKIQFNAPHGIKKITVTNPVGKKNDLILAGNSCTLDMYLPGLYSLETEKDKHEFQINPLSADESDLRTRRSVILEGEKNENIYRKRFMNIAWLFLLAALAVSAWHLYLIRRRNV